MRWPGSGRRFMAMGRRPVIMCTWATVVAAFLATRSAVAMGRAAGDLGWQVAAPLAEGISRVYGWISAGAPDRAGC
jgi:hypothetical protein